MRIAVDTSPLAPPRTGVGNFVHALLRHLVRQGDGHEFVGLSTGLRPVDLGDVPGLAGARHVRAPTRLMYRVWLAGGRPRADLLAGGADVYHATNYFLPPVSRAARVLSIYDLAFMKTPQLASPKIVGPFARNMARFAREADAIVVCSEATQRDVCELLDVPGEKVTVTYGAVDDDFTPPQPDEARALLKRHYGLEAPFLLYVGTIEPRKNVAGLLSAFALAAPQLPHELVVVGGAGWEQEDLAARVRENGLEKRVRFLGYLGERAHLPALYAAADAFALPSFYEGFGLPVLEAMHCGCPVIVSDRTSLPEVAGDAGCYVNPDDNRHMAEAMLKVLGDAALRGSMREKGLARAARFSWDRCAKETLAVYERAAHARAD